MSIYDPTKMPADSYDSHTHLNDDDLYRDVEAYVGRAEEFRVMEMNVVGYDAKGNQRALAIAEQFENVHAILGFQPDSAKEFDEEAQKILATQLKNPVVVGVGETGLDYYWDNSTREEQKAAFIKHIELAQEFDLPITIHSRDAYDDVYEILKAHNVNKGVMHSFAGSVEQAQKFQDLGLYISFSGVVSFKKAEEVRDAARNVQLDRLLVETDAPYLAPVPNRGKRNEPAYVKYVVDALAEAINMDAKELAKLTTDNAHNLWKK